MFALYLITDRDYDIQIIKRHWVIFELSIMQNLHITSACLSSLILAKLCDHKDAKTF